jgi:hypothetical protein
MEERRVARGVEWSVTRSGVSGPGPTRARHVKDRPSTVCSAVNGSQRPTLMRQRIVMRTPFDSAAPSLMAWRK